MSLTSTERTMAFVVKRQLERELEEEGWGWAFSFVDGDPEIWDAVGAEYTHRLAQYAARLCGGICQCQYA